MLPCWTRSPIGLRSGQVHERRVAVGSAGPDFGWAPGCWAGVGRGGLGTVIVTTARSIVLFLRAAVAEIGGAWLAWQVVREHKGLLWIGAGVIALGSLVWAWPWTGSGPIGGT
jgi:hypothetical protein